MATIAPWQSRCTGVKPYDFSCSTSIFEDAQVEPMLAEDQGCSTLSVWPTRVTWAREMGEGGRGGEDRGVNAPVHTA